MAKFLPIIAGAALLVAGAALIATGVGAALAPYLISAGVGMVISGIGTMLSKGAVATGNTAARSSIAPWNVVYGRSRVGGTLIYFGEFVYTSTPWYDVILDIVIPVIALIAQALEGQNYWLDMVYVVACHPCEGIDALLFDGQRVQLSTAGGAFNGIVGDSFTPVQQSVNISHITRVNNVVTVTLEANIPLLEVGDNVIVQKITGDPTLVGTYPVESIISQVVGSPGSLIFTYLCGGPPSIVDNEGECLTTWPDYGQKVHMEVLLGDHTATFPGMLHGTAYDGDPGNIVPYQNNPWTTECLCLGRTVVFLRVHYSDQYFASGLPTISFIVRGKNDIVDPRTSPSTAGYTENAALCIADYLCHPTWGFKANLGTDLPLPQWIAAANTCDESVALAKGGTEPRYRVDGTFPLTMKRGEVLQNLLTSCGGRLIVTAGQFILQPAAWGGVAFELGPQTFGFLAVPPFVFSPVMTVLSSYTGATGIDAYAGFYIGTVGVTGLFGDAIGPWLFEKDPWGVDSYGIAQQSLARFDRHVMIPEEYDGLTQGTIHAQFDIEQSFWGTSTPPAVLTIFECWIDNPTDLTCNGKPHPVIPETASSELSDSCSVPMAFDGDPTTGWAASGPTGWLLVDAGAAWNIQILYSYSLTQLAAQPVENMAAGWVMEGSNDGSTWTTLDQQTGQTWALGETKTFYVYKPDCIYSYYRYFRLTVTANNGGANLMIADLHLYGTQRMSAQTTGYVPMPPAAGSMVINPENTSDYQLGSSAVITVTTFPNVDNGPWLQLSAFATPPGYPCAGSPVGDSPVISSPNVASETALALSQASGPFKWSPKVSIRDLYNGCKGTFISPGNKWQSTDFPPYAQDSIHGYGGSPLDFPFGDANLAADGGDRRWLDIQLPFTISVSAAQRLAKIELLRRRQQGTGTFAFNLMLYQAMALDIVRMTLPLLGWSNKLLEIAAFRFTFDKTGDKEVPLLGTSIDFQETDPSVYAWSVTEELSPEGYQQASIPTNVGPTGSGTLADTYLVNGT